VSNTFRREAEGLLQQALDAPGATFRDGQLEAIHNAVELRARTLVVQRTGWGKSMVYFIATRLLRMRGAGPTLIVSPLLALMRNQIQSAAPLGIRAATLNSENQNTWKEIEKAIVGGELDVLLISPERLANDRFVENVLGPIAGKIGLFVVDEAHCISDWGHDFRPDYRRIRRIISGLPKNLPVIATTATANSRVVDDVAAQLGDDIHIQRGPLTRESLQLEVYEIGAKPERLAWLAEELPKVDGSGIIYALTKRDTRTIARYLSDRGIDAVAYNADLSGEDRIELERRLQDNDVKALVATTALGMGYDKPDLGFVMHYQAPQSVIHYYQQVGRAGRGIARARGILLSGREDSRINRFFIENAFPTPQDVELILEALELSEEGLNKIELEAVVNLKQSQIDKTLKFLSVEDNAPVVKRATRWVRTPHSYSMDLVGIQRLTDRRNEEWAEVQRYVSHAGCRMRFLAEALDDSLAEDCGRCDRCTGGAIAASNVEGTAEAIQYLSKNSGLIRPRKRWARAPSLEHYGFSGTIKAELRVEEGRYVCNWGDGVWSELVSGGKEHGHFDETLVARCVELVREEWNPDITWVTCVPSLRRPKLVASLAKRIANALGLPFSACVHKIRETAPQKTMENSYHQASNLDGAFEIDETAVVRGPALLIDDMVDSGWTFCIVGALLRRSIREPVYPLALASTLDS
tara:strand:- start:104266 stop:106347 length:2082 start_codon:yes stop_codon:yes gene_type:complete